MTDSLTVFGTSYTGVTGIKAKGTGNGVLTYIRPTGTKSITANGTGIDVAAYSTVDVSVSGGGGDTVFLVTVSYNSTSGMWEPDCTYAQVAAAHTAGKTIAVQVGGTGAVDDAAADGVWDDGYLVYEVRYLSSGNMRDAQYGFSSDGLTENYNDELVFAYFQSKTVSPTESQQTVTPDSEYTGLSSVTVNAISSTYVGSGIDRRDSTDLTASGATVTAPAGYYASAATKSVASGTEGTPTATKGSVSNHSVSVTPSVTNSAGYIAGGTHTGTAVTVSASELVSGSETKTANGTYDVTALAQLVVSVASPVKTATGTFTGNGTRTIDVTCAFEPDIVYFTSNPGTTASSGTVAAIIVRDMMAATRYRNNSTSNSHYAIPDIANLNTSGSSYSWRATYANSKVTLYCYSSNARGLLTSGRTYTYTFVKWTN